MNKVEIKVDEHFMTCYDRMPRYVTDVLNVLIPKITIIGVTVIMTQVNEYVCTRHIKETSVKNVTDIVWDLRVQSEQKI